MLCRICKREACVALKSHNTAFCSDCFLQFFSRQVERGIEKEGLLTRDDKILVALSGGKDSLSLMLELSRQGYAVTGFHLDLGIPNSSEKAREAVQAVCEKEKLPLVVESLATHDLAIPDVAAHIRRPICSACGTIKRYFFNRKAVELGMTVLATGHNLDDEVARLLSNTLRWDKSYLASQGPNLPAENGFVRKVKPLWRLTEFEIANYAFLQGIHNVYTTCPYSHGASFSVLKGLMQRLEEKMPGRKIDFYQGFLERGRPHFTANKETPPITPCPACSCPSSAEGLCSVCRMKQKIQEEKARCASATQ
ncbi:MAG: adenine nucleotide alpha hydrolase family protein [Desulfovibrionaceae bacterium]|nr:adenine nucleotide alpha hydrolase family protein [Desulfovibrionaceae bacterium]